MLRIATRPRTLEVMPVVALASARSLDPRRGRPVRRRHRIGGPCNTPAARVREQRRPGTRVLGGDVDGWDGKWGAVAASGCELQKP